MRGGMRGALRYGLRGGDRMPGGMPDPASRRSRVLSAPHPPPASTPHPVPPVQPAPHPASQLLQAVGDAPEPSFLHEFRRLHDARGHEHLVRGLQDPLQVRGEPL